MEGERLACGNAHADNVAPALLGGLVLIRSYDPLDVVRLPFPENLRVGVLYPTCEIPTSEARRILKTSVPIKDAIKAMGECSRDWLQDFARAIPASLAVAWKIISLSP
jgi:homoserine kinase